MKDGYIELTKENAKKYGEPFYKASISLKELYKLDIKDNKDYYSLILLDNTDYIVRKSELEGLNLEFPKTSNKRL